MAPGYPRPLQYVGFGSAFGAGLISWVLADAAAFVLVSCSVPLQSGLEPTVEPTGFKPVGGSVADF